MHTPFGQHFLTSEGIIDQLIESAEIGPNDNVLEIGPGKGALTKALLERAKRVVAVEIDPELSEKLKKEFRDKIESGAFTLVEQDVRDFNPLSYNLKAKSYKLVSNIPYYLTGSLIRKLLSEWPQPVSASLLMQKEVAERIVARDEVQSILSVSVSAYGEPKIVRTVKPGSFSPPPSVDSAILSIKNISRGFFTENNIDERSFFDIVRKGFAHKRKKLAGNLGISGDLLRQCGISEDARAETLSLEQWKCLSRAIS